MCPTPTARPAFTWLACNTRGNVDEIFAEEKARASQLVEGQVVLDGKPVLMRYSQTDMGLPEQLFDGDKFTLIRGLEANPFILELHFPEPRPLTGLQAAFGSVNYDITARLYPTTRTESQQFTRRSTANRMAIQTCRCSSITPRPW